MKSVKKLNLWFLREWWKSGNFHIDFYEWNDNNSHKNSTGECVINIFESLEGEQ
jgi:hypothetical protein